MRACTHGHARTQANTHANVQAGGYANHANRLAVQSAHVRANARLHTLARVHGQTRTYARTHGKALAHARNVTHALTHAQRVTCAHTAWLSEASRRLWQVSLFTPLPAEAPPLPAAMAMLAVTLAAPPRAWVLSYSRRPHTHDIRALAVSAHPTSAVVASAGIDTQLSLIHTNAFERGTPTKLLPLYHASVSFCAQSRLLLHQRSAELRLWQLPPYESSVTPVLPRRLRTRKVRYMLKQAQAQAKPRPPSASENTS
eukprot:6208136-Pleurochrysis_carterae.AAC.4